MAVVLVPDLFDSIDVPHHELSIRKWAITNVFGILGLWHGAFTSEREGDFSTFHSVLALVVTIWFAFVGGIKPIRAIRSLRVVSLDAHNVHALSQICGASHSISWLTILPVEENRLFVDYWVLLTIPEELSAIRSVMLFKANPFLRLWELPAEISCLAVEIWFTGGSDLSPWLASSWKRPYTLYSAWKVSITLQMIAASFSYWLAHTYICVFTADSAWTLESV